MLNWNFSNLFVIEPLKNVFNIVSLRMVICRIYLVKDKERPSLEVNSLLILTWKFLLLCNLWEVTFLSLSFFIHKNDMYNTSIAYERVS